MNNETRSQEEINIFLKQFKEICDSFVKEINSDMKMFMDKMDSHVNDFRKTCRNTNDSFEKPSDYEKNIDRPNSSEDNVVCQFKNTENTIEDNLMREQRNINRVDLGSPCETKELILKEQRNIDRVDRISPDENNARVEDRISPNENNDEVISCDNKESSLCNRVIDRVDRVKSPNSEIEMCCENKVSSSYSVDNNFDFDINSIPLEKNSDVLINYNFEINVHKRNNTCEIGQCLDENNCKSKESMNETVYIETKIQQPVESLRVDIESPMIENKSKVNRKRKFIREGASNDKSKLGKPKSIYSKKSRRVIERNKNFKKILHCVPCNNNKQKKCFHAKRKSKYKNKMFHKFPKKRKFVISKWKIVFDKGRNLAYKLNCMIPYDRGKR